MKYFVSRLNKVAVGTLATGSVVVQRTLVKSAHQSPSTFHQPTAITNFTSDNSIIKAPVKLQDDGVAILTLGSAARSLAVSALAFTLLSIDVNGLDQQVTGIIDSTVHTVVTSNVLGLDDATRRLVGGTFLSNTPIVLGIAAWLSCSCIVLWGWPNFPTKFFQPLIRDKEFNGGRFLPRIGIAGALYWMGGGSCPYGDPWLVDVLKHLFHRTRPSPVHSTFAFPSGHTTEVTFIWGVVLFMLLPTAISAVRQVPQTGKHEYPPLLVRAFDINYRKIPRKLIWAITIATTGSGRVLADAHWTTDVLAGACLGIALVNATVLLCHIYDEFSNTE